MLEYGRTVGGPALRRDDVPRARPDAQGDGAVPDGAEGRVLPGLRGDRRDQGRLLGRHRGRHRNLLRLRAAGDAASSPTRRSTSTGRSSRSRRAARSSAGTSACRSKASRSTSTPSTSPCWGMLEKLAPTFLAGMPAIVKPATVTSYLTEAVVRAMIESEILPEGALQLICGSAGDLLDHLDLPGRRRVHRLGGDRAASSRAPARSSSESVRFNMEADSLNFSHARPRRRAGHARSSISSSRKSCAR